MVAAGLLQEDRIGRTRQVRANPTARLFESLRQMITLTYGPVPVLEDELRELDGVENAFVYGSWAARHEGVEGPEPHDVDVLVVGKPDVEELFEAGERARRRLQREVNIRTVSATAWTDPRPADPFLQHVHTSPLVALDLGAEA